MTDTFTIHGVTFESECEPHTEYGVRFPDEASTLVEVIVRRLRGGWLGLILAGGNRNAIWEETDYHDNKEDAAAEAIEMLRDVFAPLMKANNHV